MQLVEFRPSRNRRKKYDALIKTSTGIRVVSFGDKAYGQYEDKTPLKLYSHMNHYDEQRRKSFHRRHQHTRDRMWSPSWFAATFLW